MSLKMKKVLVSWFFSLFLVFAAITGAQAYTDVLSFGDSLSDNGKTDGYGNGVYSNGKVWVEYLSQNLNVSLMDMAYGGAVSGQNVPYAWKSVYNATYNAYIAGGAGASVAAYYANANANASGYDSKYGLQWQVNEYLTNVKGSANISNTLITMTAGGNDYFNYVANAVLGTPYSPQSAIDYAAGLYAPQAAAANIAAAVGALIANGGNYFLIQNLAIDNDWGKGFNYYLSIYLAQLSGLNPEVSIKILDMTKFIADVDNLTDTWIAKCAANPEACEGTTYAWWDQVGVHPTTEVHRQIGAYATTAVPEPTTIILLILGVAGLAGARRRMK